MFRGLYTAASGMLVGLKRQEAIAHNLANMQTVGFKSDQAILADFPSLLLTRMHDEKIGPGVGRVGTGVTLSAITTNFRDGPLKLTDHPFDLALVGDGFFQVQTADSVRYTRDGRFHRNAEGQLVTADKFSVLGENGPINLPAGELVVSSSGEIFVGGSFIDRLSLVRFDNLTDLIKDGQTNFLSRGAEPQLLPLDNTNIYQGYLEEANVEEAQVIAEMSSVLRAYEANQRMVQFQDQINGRTVSEIGRV
jgi:flagellar basal-body rod protein FlgG